MFLAKSVAPLVIGLTIMAGVRAGQPPVRPGEPRKSDDAGRVRVEQISDRACFVRRESPVSLRFAVTNLERAPLAGAEVSISLDGMAETTTKLADLPPGKPIVVDYPLDTSLRPARITLWSA